MGHVMVAAVRKIRLLRQHVGESTRLQGRQLLLGKCRDSFHDLSLRLTREYHLSPFVSHWKDGTHRRRIQTEGASNFGIPKLRIVEWGHPPALHDAYETILAFDGGFIAVRPEDQNFCVVRYGIWSRTSRQGYFGISIRHQVTVKRGHVGIRSFGLRLHLRDRSQCENKHGAS